MSSAISSDPEPVSLLRGRAALVPVPTSIDSRGRLSALELNGLIVPARAFIVGGVPDGATRGGHAHRQQRQLLLRLTGRIVVDMFFEGEEAAVTLDGPALALLIEPKVWAQQTYYDAATLLVFSSAPYDPDSYIYDKMTTERS